MLLSSNFQINLSKCKIIFLNDFMYFIDEYLLFKLKSIVGMIIRMNRDRKIT